MSWAKLDDGFWMHPKVVRAGNEGAGIFVRCLSYCGAYLTDGLVPEPVALSIAGSKAKLDAVVAAGLLERLESDSLYIRDYADYNPLRAQIEAERADRKERASRAARKRWDGATSRA